MPILARAPSNALALVLGFAPGLGALTASVPSLAGVGAAPGVGRGAIAYAALPAGLVPRCDAVAEDERALLRALAGLPAPERAERLAAFALRGAASARAAAAELAERATAPGAAASEPGLDGALRRGLAWLVFEAGGADELEPALAALVDPDPLVRVELARFLGRADLGAARLAERASALVRLAANDPEPAVRERAVRSALELDRPETLGALELALDVLAPAERVLAARELAGRARLRERLFARVAAAWPDAKAPFDDGLVAALLPALGRALVDDPALAADAKTRALLRAAAQHPDGRVRRGAREAVDALLARLELFGEPERAARVLGALAEDGFEARELAFARARFELRHSATFDGARAIAAELARENAAASTPEGRYTLARARLLEAQAAFASGDDAGARGAFAGARAALAALLAERRDLGLPRAGREHAAALELDAVARLGELALELAPDARADGSHADPFARAALSGVARGASDPAGAVPRAANDGRAAGERGTSPERAAGPGTAAKDGSAAEDPAARARRILELARALHVAALESQRAAWRADVEASTGFDALLDADLSPLALVLDDPRAPAWPARRALALRELVCIALARVAPAEFPGFAPKSDAEDPLADPRRLALLKDAQLARLDLFQREFNRLSGRLLRAALEDPCGADPELSERAALLYFERQDAIDSLRDAETEAGAAGPGPAAFLELRVVSTSALQLARAWRDEGRPETARALLEAMRADLDRSGAGARYVWGLELAAEIEIALGTTWGDGGDPVKAETELQRAVERLEELEELVKERKMGAGLVRRLETMRSSALVSLAVNANVKQKDPVKALAYFERAWALRQDEFMRVLRACYSARAGRADEARAILREIAPSPLSHYNMACTYALCGDVEPALDFLRREFEENQVSPGAAAKQRAWAKTDPDLASLRGDPRFEAIVGK
ncbi:MAG: hypothetical protein U1F29_03885 [Planctomycetota bacterium]